LCFCVWFVCCLVVSTSAIDCLERLVPEMTYCVSSGTINTHFTLYDLTLVTLVFFFRRQVQAVYRTYSTSRLLSNPINCRVDYTMSSQRDEDRTHRSSCHFSASSCMCVYVCVFTGDTPLCFLDADAARVTSTSFCHLLQSNRFKAL